ncbi:MAG: type VI secretion system tip protein VgrG [Deltaproteobacteria bacterium]|nr:MAG: type VI secretion system tip protein VgrG [Deltaproteobacteria bacterium]
MAQLATLTAAELGDGLRLVAFSGHEALCRPYRFDLHFTVERRTALDLAAGIGARATLTLQREEGLACVFHGILSQLDLLVQTPEWALYRASLVPALWRLGLTQHSRVFTKQSLPDIIEAVLEGAGLTGQDYELRLASDYPPEELVVQYRESQLDFLHRWLEHEGLYYYFEQAEDREKLIIVDHRSLHDKLVDKKVRYRPLTGHDTSAGECFDSFAVMHSATAGAVRLTDYDYARPMLDVSATANVSRGGFGEVSVHAGRFFDPDAAQRFAQLRAEQLQAAAVTVHAAGTALHATVGHLVELSEHPTDGLNTSYLVTEARHFCNQLGQESPSAKGAGNPLAHYVKPAFEEQYRVEVTALDATTQYRPPRATPLPRVWGYEAGTVDGSAESDYAQLDDQGRYRVKFQFDESELPDGTASTYVRMMQPHGGTTEGFHFPLRKGTEVILSFLGGDPDRPVISGVVPNATTASPVTDGNYTENVIRTGGDNSIVIDDRKGKEHIAIYTPNENTQLHLGYPVTVPGLGDPPRNVEASVFLETDATAAFTFGGDWYTDVTGTKDEHVKGAVTERFDCFHDTKLAGHRKVTIGANEDREVGGYWNLTCGVGTTLKTPAWGNKVDGLTSINTGTMIQTSGDTRLNFGPTHLNWGPTDGTIKSLDLSIPGGVTILTPTWKVVDPKRNETIAFLNEKCAMSVSFHSLKSSIQSLKVDVSQTYLSSYGMKLDVKGLHREVKGPDIKTSGATVGTAAVQALTAGMINFF